MVVFSLAMDGDQPLANLDAASREYRRRDYDMIIFTGGVFSEGQTIPAAKAMAAWWHENRPARETPVLVETESLTTRQNVVNVVEGLLLDTHGLRLDTTKLTVVSERWHLLGIQLLFLLLYRKWTRAVASKFRITFREKIARLVRLPLYVCDPRGIGRLSQHKLNARTQL